MNADQIERMAQANQAVRLTQIHAVSSSQAPRTSNLHALAYAAGLVRKWVSLPPRAHNTLAGSLQGLEMVCCKP